MPWLKCEKGRIKCQIRGINCWPAVTEYRTFDTNKSTIVSLSATALFFGGIDNWGCTVNGAIFLCASFHDKRLAVK